MFVTDMQNTSVDSVQYQAMWHVCEWHFSFILSCDYHSTNLPLSIHQSPTICKISNY